MNIIDTLFKVEYELIDVTAAEDANESSSSVKSFSDISLLSEGTNFDNEGTLEKNFFILDGSFSEFEDDPEVAFFSTEMSDINGDFDNNPTFEIDFTMNHSSAGFTLYFADDYPSECIITWFDSSGSMLQKYTQKITGKIQIVYWGVENYTKLRFEFTKANPYRYIKLNKILFGIIQNWDETNISSGKLVEDASMISDSLAINTLDFDFVDVTDNYNLGNSTGIHKYIQRGQRVHPYEVVRGNSQYLGDYYIDTFSESTGLISFSTINILGLMDTIQFVKGDIYNGVRAEVVLKQIFNTCGIDTWESTDEINDTLLYGSLAPMTCREALKEVLFATQSYLDCTRRSGFALIKKGKYIANNITRNDKISTKVTKREYVSGVDVQYTEYIAKTDTSEIVKGTYDAGYNLITFSSPYQNIAASEGTITEYGKYYCILYLEGETYVTLTGTGYDSNQITTSYSQVLSAGESENVKSFTSALCNLQMAKSLAQKIYEYYAYRLELEIQYLADDEVIKYWGNIENADKSFKDYIAGFESMQTDLTNGFVTTAKLVGYYDYSGEEIYTGDELYCGDNTIM